MNSRVLMRLLFLVAVLAVVVGVTIAALESSQPATFGWFAYSPLADPDHPLDGLHVVSTTGMVGLVVWGAGLAALAFWAGLRIGGRRPRSGT